MAERGGNGLHDFGCKKEMEVSWADFGMKFWLKISELIAESMA